MNNWVKIGLTSITSSAAAFAYFWWKRPTQLSITNHPEPTTVLPESVVPAVDVAEFELPSPDVVADVAVPGVGPGALSSLVVAVVEVIYLSATSLELSTSEIGEEEPCPLIGEYDFGECVICYKIPQIKKSWPPCGHVFCHECLYFWCEINIIKQKDWKCPYCNQVFKKFQDKHGKHSRHQLIFEIKDRSRLGFKDCFTVSLRYFGEIFYLFLVFKYVGNIFEAAILSKETDVIPCTFNHLKVLFSGIILGASVTSIL